MTDLFRNLQFIGAAGALCDLMHHDSGFPKPPMMGFFTADELQQVDDAYQSDMSIEDAARMIYRARKAAAQAAA